LTKQVINIGSSGNDGTGDQLRTAMGKVNDNFTDLYTNYQSSAGLSANVATITSNNTSFVGSVTAANVVSNSQLTANLANYTNNSAMPAFIGNNTANNTLYVGSVTAANIVSNAQLSANLTNYQTTAGLSANVSTLTSNNSLYLGNVAANQYAYANLISSYQTSAGLAGNVATLTSNNSLYLGGVVANAYVNTLGSYVLGGVITFAANAVYGNATVNASIISNSTTTYFTGVSNNSLSLGGSLANAYLTVAGLASNMAILPANVATYLGAPGNSGNTSGIYSFGTVNAAVHSIGTAFIANSLVVLTGGNFVGNTNGVVLGYRDKPQNFTNTSYTLVANDAGKHILTQNTGTVTQTITVPNNATVSMLTGVDIRIIVQSTGSVSLAASPGVSMYLASNSTTKSTLTLASYSSTTLLKIGSDTWIVTGTGVS